MSAISWRRTEAGGLIIIELTFNPADQRIVIFSKDLLAELCLALDEIEHELSAATEPDGTADILVLTSAKSDCFVAGANIGEMLAMRDADDIRHFVGTAHALFGRIATLPLPTVALIDGACMGGGTELALACRWRVASDNPKTQIALPEVTLGIIPGWGGTQRLPRLVGMEAALPIITGGRPLTGEEAAAIGLVDACVPVSKMADAIVKLLRQADKEQLSSGARESTPMPEVPPDLVATTSAAIAKERLHPDAPQTALDVLVASAGASMQKGLALEQEAFVRCLGSDTGYNLMSMFLHRGALRKESFGIDAATAGSVSRTAVLGAGVMGGGIAWALSNAGLPVTMKDIADEPLQRGMAAASDMYDQLVARGRMDATTAKAALQAISATTEYGAGFDGLDLVVEAVTEDLNLKKRVLAELEDRVGSGTVICTNTSSLPLDELAKSVTNPGRFVALHFFNPVNRMRLVEVAATESTSPVSLATTVELTRRLGKTPVVVRGRPGFLVNRILFPYLLEAARICDETGAAEELDSELTSFGMPMGPLRLIDEVGVDVTAKIAAALADAYGDCFQAPPLLDRMLELKQLGRKGGGADTAGFYRHTGHSAIPNAELPVSAPSGRTQSAADRSDAADRCLLMMVNEAARCVKERIVTQSLYVDLTMILGTGFPEHRGGPLRYADQRGLAKIVARMEQLSASEGSRFRPCDELRRRVEIGKNFLD